MEQKEQKEATEEEKPKQAPKKGSPKPYFEHVDNPFICNICFDTAKEPAVTKCGHLFWY